MKRNSDSKLLNTQIEQSKINKTALILQIQSEGYSLEDIYDKYIGKDYQLFGITPKTYTIVDKFFIFIDFCKK